MRHIRPFLLFLPGLLAACSAETPFIYTSPAASTPSVNKTKDELLESGIFKVCHSSASPMADVVAVAQEKCAGFGLQTRQGNTLRWQCRATAPHLTFFACYDPQMTDVDGSFIDPFDKVAVAAWETRTGRKAKLLNPNMQQFPNAGLPEASQSMSPGTATPPAPEQPSPETMAGKPTVPPPAAVLTAPSSTPSSSAAPDSGFNLPQGSWGDSFER